MKRKCYKCGINKELNENNFYKTNKKYYGGYRYGCRQCVRGSAIAYRKVNRIKFREIRQDSSDRFYGGGWRTAVVSSIAMSSNRYISITFKDYPYFSLTEHKYVMMKKLDRALVGKEEVHHIDKDRLNNNITNLLLVSSRKIHFKLYHNRGIAK